MASNRNGVILWLRRDLRLADLPALHAACKVGGPVWPVYVWDDVAHAETGAASRWRLEQSLHALGDDIAAKGGRLILRRGDAHEELRRVLDATGAGAVYWTRLYTPAAMERDKKIKQTLSESGVEAKSFKGALLLEPWEIATQSGDPYRVYTPFWKSLKAGFEPDGGSPAPETWPHGDAKLESLALEELGLSAEMNRGAAIVARFNEAGEAAAASRLDRFLSDHLRDYDDARDRLDQDGTSGLSPALAFGEISPHRIWRATCAAMAADPEAEKGGWSFLSEIAWRDFASHLGYHTPELFDRNWRSEWDSFPWREDNDDAERWRRGRTGEPVIDAAMRELYVTGRMHNRARMLVASYLTKHLLVDWRVGAEWFRDCLVDYDPASNAMGWQWAAGSGPDAAPFFRIFNPRAQAEKHDPSGAYLSAWLPDATGCFSSGLPLETEDPLGRLFFEACPRSWGLSKDHPYPEEPLVDLKAGRQRALDAYDSLKRDD